MDNDNFLSQSSKNCKFIFITGGVVSALGKGLTTAGLGALLKERGFNIKIRKFDPYFNVDTGTMSPIQHGEVYITEDGAETDLDLGHYERFVGIKTDKSDSITSGQIYNKLINKERRGDYLGKTVQVIPHVTDLIKEAIVYNTEGLDFLLCEIGGTVGDIEGQPFLEATRQMRYEYGLDRTIFVHLTFLPVLTGSDELKTKPTQHSVRVLNSVGIQPDVLVCRSTNPIGSVEKRKIALASNIREQNIIAAPDLQCIYRIPIEYYSSGFDKTILKYFGISKSYNDVLDLSKWYEIVSIYTCKSLNTVKIALIAKYVELSDAYKSVIEALQHSGIANRLSVDISIIDSSSLDEESYTQKLREFDGIIVPGGFGTRGIEGKLLSIKYARENNIPFFGICLGFQLAIIDFCKNVLLLNDVNSLEFDENAENIVISIMDSWVNGDTKVIAQSHNKGGTMRIGNYKCKIFPSTKLHEIYKSDIVEERHRHRYEFVIKYKEMIENGGGKFSAVCYGQEMLCEAFEIPSLDWFIATQYHPEFNSTPFKPSPIFVSFLEAVYKGKYVNAN